MEILEVKESKIYDFVTLSQIAFWMLWLDVFKYFIIQD